MSVETYVTSYSVQLRVYVKGGAYKWIHMKDCANIKELRKVCLMLKTSRMKESDYKAIKNETDLVT